jgi:imidazolonepropionase-like amidohydrolase
MSMNACGVASIEHMGALSRETLDRVAQGGVFLVPMLSVVDHSRQRAAATEAAREKWKLRWEGIGRVFEMALASGVRIASGTDIGCYPHAPGSRSELTLMAELGMPALAVLRAATSEAAALLRIEGLGRIRAGEIADLCAFDSGSDSRDVIGAIAAGKPSLVVQGGRVVREARCS